MNMKKLLTILFICTFGMTYGQHTIIDSCFNLYKESSNNFETQSAIFNCISSNAKITSSISRKDLTVTLGFDGPKTACQGDTILINITADNFIDAVGFSFSINFDTSKLLFLEAKKLYPLGIGDYFDFNEIPPGSIRVTSIFRIGGSFDNDKAFVQLSFVTKDDFSACTDIILSNDPIIIQLINSRPMVLPFTLNNPFTFCVTTKDCKNCPTDAGEFPYRGN